MTAGSARASRPAGIDVQAHYFVPSYVAAAEREARNDPAWGAAHQTLTGQGPDSPARSFDGRLEEMEKAGIGMSVISVSPAVFRTETLAITAAEESNRELLEAAGSDPEHFRVMASLPVPFADACLREIEAINDNPLVAALIIPCGTNTWTLDDDSFRPVWAAIVDAGLPAMIHTALEPWPPAFQRWRIGPGLGVPVETSLAVLYLIFSGVLDLYPELDIIVPQLGGVLPYLTQRLVDRGQGDAKHDVAYYLKNRLFYDNNNYHEPALRCAIDTFGADRIMLGSDYPFRGSLSQCVEDVCGAGIDESQRDAMLEGTARSLLRHIGAAQTPPS